MGGLLAALFFVFSTSGCLANIGESEAQCLSRYGNEFDEQDNLAFDVVGDKAASFASTLSGVPLTVSVIFLNGVDSHETIRVTDTSRALSEEQKNALLDSERAGLAWKRQNTIYRTDSANVTYAIEKWIRSDGAIANCWMSQKVKSKHEWTQIDLSTRDYAAAQQTLDRQDGEG